MSEDTDVLAALKQWGEMAYEGDPIVDVLLNDISRAADRIQGLEDVLEEKRLAVNGLRSALSSSQSRLSEAVKVLEEISAHEPGDGNHNLNDLIAHASVRSARQFLATLWEER